MQSILKIISKIKQSTLRSRMYLILQIIFTDYIRYWLGSIHTYSSEEAPVILVASHAEGNGADPNKVRI